MTQEPSSTISAEAILKSRSGRSLAQTDVAVTAENVEEFTPASETIAEATQLLEKLGFEVAQSGVTLTLMGEPTQFEKVFKVKLSLERDEATGDLIVEPEGELVVPDSLKGVVEEVVFPERPEFF